MTDRTVWMLPCREVHVWSLPLDDPFLMSQWSILSPHEQQRALRMPEGPHRNRFVACRAAVRMIVSQYVDVPATQLQFSEGRFGKPYVSGAGGDVLFSVSHSGAVGLLALNRHLPIGVDVEHLERVNGSAEWCAEVLSSYERQQFREVACTETARWVACCWARKEAVLKATGIGLLDQPAAVSVMPARAGKVWRRMVSGPERGRWVWLVRDLDVSETVAAAVALVLPLGGPRGAPQRLVIPRVRVRAWSTWIQSQPRKAYTRMPPSS